MNEHMNDEIPSQADAYREMVNNIGSDNPQHCWILTPFDTWERNPAYVGPEQPHPEDHQVDLTNREEVEAFNRQFTEWHGDSDGSVGCD